MGAGTTIAIVLVIILVLVGMVALFFMGTYNGFVTKGLEADQKWSLVEAQYQRRADLIPNLVSTVKGVANFEQTTLTAVVNARSAWASAGTQEQKVDAANQLDSAISRLLVTVEAYPTLTATQAYKDLMVSLEGTENRISFARGEYNTAVQSYNAAIKTFPGNVMAGMFGFTPKKFYESKPGSENTPVVDFNVS